MYCETGAKGMVRHGGTADRFDCAIASDGLYLLISITIVAEDWPIPYTRSQNTSFDFSFSTREQGEDHWVYPG